MRFYPIPLMAFVLLLSLSVSAQDDSRFSLLLKSGTIVPPKNITAENIDNYNRVASRTNGKALAVIQFEQIPSPSERLQLKQSGIELLDYVPNNAYTATITGSLEKGQLLNFKVRSVIELTPVQKMQPELAAGMFPAHAIKVAGTVDVWISFPTSYVFEEVKGQLAQKNIDVIGSRLKEYRILELRIASGRLTELASLPFVEFVQVAPAPDKALNYNSLFASRATVLKASLANGGSNLNGQDVVVGVGDDGDIQTHLDFTNRLINRTGEIPRAHATHVAGTVGGAGIIQQVYSGYAPKSTLVGQYFSKIITNAPIYVTDHGMVITNNSYGSVEDDCEYNGLYDLSAKILDEQAFALPELLHVFAAGNDGSNNCNPYPTGFNTVLGGYQSSKNVITVGSSDFKRDISGFSSRGPVKDGRVKPEIISMGQFLPSTWVNNQYSYNNGTSMAAPGVAGGTALLVQRYRQLNGGANPKNGLMKALLCNGADDRGNPGPDYTYGFGNMNLIRSLRMIENGSFFNTTVAQGATNTQTVSVPLNTVQLKVMLYWNDPSASVMASNTLVNDLDLQVDSSANSILPFKLDPSPSAVGNMAVRNADHTNNIEQVVINNPVAGNYQLKVIGTSLPQGPSQEYFLVYDIIPQSLVLTNPVGGETLTPTGTYFFGLQVFDTMYVQWDDYGQPDNETFTLEFSSDGGSNWTTLSNSIPAASRLYKWVVPNTPTYQGRIRLSKNNTPYTQTSGDFVITSLPVVSLDAVQCEGYIKINWASVPGATDYEVMMLQGDEMVSVATTSGLTYTFSGLSKDSTYWVTMRARINGNTGRRANAIARQPNSGTCTGTISDNDLKVDGIISPTSSGRLFTSTALSASVPITIRLKNLDDDVSSGDINVSYSINGGPSVNEVITSPVADIGPGATLVHTFTTNANLSLPGPYSIEVTATKASDPVVNNNTLTKVYKQLINPVIDNASLPWLDNLEGISAQSYTAPQIGINGRDRYDFVNSTVNGRLRSFINTGIAYSGSSALTLDIDRYNVAGNVDSLSGTFNLSTFTSADEIRLDFRYKNHGQKSNAANKVWIRGSDADVWIEMYDLYVNQPAADGTYKLSASLQLNDSLSAYSQSFSSSFQVRWGQWGQYMAADNESGAGYTIDDIRIYRAIDDIQLMSIDTPVAIACNLNATVPVKVTVRNTMNTAINNIPIVLNVDGSVIATENILSIAPNSSLQYTFAATADLSAPGNHTMEVWVNLATDNVKENDTARLTINSLPNISNFPYLENFESNNGYWYTTTNAWQYGSINSVKLKRSASGSKAWKTNTTGYYNSDELSYLYSPCFNISTLPNPTLSFSIALDIEDCGDVLCDGAYMEYSTNGISWSRLGANGQGTNWYNKAYSGNNLWSIKDYHRWHVATIPLSVIPVPQIQLSQLRFRFVITSDPSVVGEGIAVDDIHIYSNPYGIYDGITMGAPVIQTVNNNNNWVDFLESGKLIASVKSPTTAMGSTEAQAYINTGAVRISSNQFYHDRNITLKPANATLATPATVRFYFLDTEMERLINATGCGFCSKPAMAYELGVTKYTNSNKAVENGTLADNAGGLYQYILPANTRIVPFDKGYYAEFEVSDFSEFWLNNGGINASTPLPLTLLSFTSRKQNGKDVLAEWITTDEVNVDRFELEVARGNADYQLNQFTKIGQVPARNIQVGNQYYNFIDHEPAKNGTRYYRLKMIDQDGSFKYSPIRPVVFSEDLLWSVYPNPSTGLFYLNFQLAEGEMLTIKVYDASGRTIQQQMVNGTGFLQKIPIDLKANGLYMLEAVGGNKKQFFKLLKQ